MCLVNIFETYGHMISTIALVVTFFAVIWYGWQTRGLKKETVKQTELCLRPFIFIDIFSDRLVYKNIGQSPALDVKTKPFETKTFILNFEKWGLIEPDERRELNPKGEAKPLSLDGVVRPVKAHPPEFTPWALHKRNSNLELILNIHYKNIEKAPYQTKVKVNRKGIEFLDTRKI